ncbi:GGDEF and EAL domain-containing protein [Nitrosomonas sp.]|uniref:sensor domain-containing protein n=1 Tax=Nitrosomonas sp. TaxID=42353 RepID=UPI0027319C71|nr:GGDEF and EAL domain-containing protein [Nitrosomonas sp.]MDP2225389.1 EAL domain-containing protein [Nitrosomonas sp.]
MIIQYLASIPKNMKAMFISKDEIRINLINGLVLTILVTLICVLVFIFMQQNTKSILTENLTQALQNKKLFLEEIIGDGILDTRTAANRHFLIQNLEQINTEQNTDKNLLRLADVTEKLSQANFSGIVIYDKEANEVIRNDHVTQKQEFMVKLETDSGIQAFLLWNQGIILRVMIDVMNEKGQQIGNIMTERRLPVMSKVFTESYQMNKTGDFLLCAPVKENHQEMDCFIRGIGKNQFTRMQRTMSNEPLPASYALDGQSGVKFTKDYRQVSVVAAHSPMAYGLSMVLKVDEEELFNPIVEQFKSILLYLFAFMVFSLGVFYRLTAPLVHKLTKAERYAQKNSAELSAYIDAIGKLALISVADKKGRILEVNEAFCKVSGYSREELIDQDHRILNSGIQPREFFVKMWKTIAHGDVWHDEICNRSKIGASYWVDSTIVPIKNENGRIERYLSVRVDITSRKKNEILLRERLKESICLHKVRYILGLGLAIDETFQKILDQIVQAIQFPDICRAEIESENQYFSSHGFNAKNFSGDVANRLQTQIVVNGVIKGQLAISYIAALPFLLPEEQGLVDTIAHDIGRWLEHQEDENRIAEMATHDALTGLPNRHLLHTRIEQGIAQNSISQTQMAILFIDLDHFKMINDSLGHDTGDLLLKDVSKRLLSCVRAEDTVARQGGDEFIVILRHIAHDSDASLVAQKILDILKPPFQFNKMVMHIGCSIGISLFPTHGRDAETLLKNSDIAMYGAKGTGRNNFMLFAPNMNQLIEEKHDLSTDLRYAIERNELTLFYQPVVNMPSHELRSMEVLLRWEHPEKGLISPLKFIPLAEENGLIIPIGEWVLQTACEQIRTWRDQGYEVPKLAINLSAKQFRDDNLVDKIASILDKSNIEVQSISLELTESTLVDNIEEVVKKLNLLNNMGLQIAIDDFGTGYSSLSYLKRFPISTLKIDRAFVQNITIDKNDNAIIAAIIAIADSMKIDVIAEGIETKEQLNLLIQHGCKRFQGYYFSKPLPVAEIENRLEENQNYLSRNRRLCLVK